MDTQELWQAVKNATLFCRTKTWNGGEARFKQIDEDRFTVCASDDFVGIEIVAAGRWPVDEFYLPMKALKAFENDLRKLLDAGKKLKSLKVVEGYKDKPSEPEWWELFDELMGDFGKVRHLVSDWAINPERLNMLNRLEPKGKYPLALQHSMRVDEPYIAWRYGPVTRGVLMPLDISTVPGEYQQYLNIF